MTKNFIAFEEMSRLEILKALVRDSVGHRGELARLNNCRHISKLLEYYHDGLAYMYHENFRHRTDAQNPHCNADNHRVTCKEITQGKSSRDYI